MACLGLAFQVTYIKQQGPVAWDVGTYRMTIPQSEGTKREDHWEIPHSVEAHGTKLADRSRRLVE